MKKLFSKIVSGLMIIACVITLMPVQQANAVSYAGGGTEANPYVLNLQTIGEDTMKYTVPSNGNGYAYFTLKFAKDVKITLKNQGYYTMYLDDVNGSIIENISYKAGTTANLKIKGNKGKSGELYITLQAMGESLTGWDSMENANDISRGYDSMNVNFEKTGNEVWYKFTITKQSVISLAIDDTFAAFDIYNDKKETVIDHGEYIKENKMMFYTVMKMQNKLDEKCISYKLYKTGTYYICISKTSGYDGKMKFAIRDYVPISSITFKKGNKINIATKYLRSTTTVNPIVKVNPGNTDGAVAYSVFDKNFFGTNENSKKVILTSILPVKYGTGTIKYYDERNVKVGEVTVKVTPETIKSIECYGTTNRIDIYVKNEINTGNGDTIKVYRQKGKTWKLVSSVKKSKLKDFKKAISVKKLKANTNYKFRLTNYDSKTKTESPKSKVFVAGTGINKAPKILGVSKKSIVKKQRAITHNPGKLNEWKEYYSVFSCYANVKVSKVKGATGYSFSNGCKIKKTSGRIEIAGSHGSAAGLPKSAKLKVCAYRKINSYSVAYGKYSKAKSVSVR